MDKNFIKNDYHNQKDIEERVQIVKETCNSEEEIAEAIERSKRKLKSSEPPYGYTKFDEKITTKVYKVPENQYIKENNIIKEEDYYENKNMKRTDYNDYQSDELNNFNNIDYNNRNANFKLEYVSSVNPSKMKYVENYENNYNYNNKTPKTFTKYVPYTGGRIENCYENNISKDGQYLVTISLSKISNESVPNNYSNKNNNINNFNYTKQKNETSKNIQIPKKEIIKSNNYNYRKEKNEVTKKTEVTSQKMSKQIQIQKGQNYIKENNVSSHSTSPPGKETKTVIKSYKKEIIGGSDIKNDNKAKNIIISKQTNINYKRKVNN